MYLYVLFGCFIHDTPPLLRGHLSSPSPLPAVTSAVDRGPRVETLEAQWVYLIVSSETRLVVLMLYNLVERLEARIVVETSPLHLSRPSQDQAQHPDFVGDQRHQSA